MKIKIFLSILALLIVIKSVNGQNYSPLIDNSCWYIFIANIGGASRTTWIIPQKDTLIGSLTYKKYIDSTDKRRADFIREDVAHKKVFKYVDYYGDVILFDFSLHISDSITLFTGPRYVVFYDDSVTVSPGKKRRMIGLNCIYPGPPQEFWIEGVGTFNHPFKIQNELPSDPSYQLNCSYQNGNVIFNRGVSANGCTPSCCPIPPKIGESKIIYSKWYPNPFYLSTTFQSDKDLKNVTITVYTICGQKVKEIKNISGTKIILNRDNLPSGLYIVKTMQENKTFSTDKLLILGK
jgi:hypothetical protein